MCSQTLAGIRSSDLAGMAVPQWRDGLRALMPNCFGRIVSNVKKFRNA